jgi:hypothetical protein
LERVRNHDVTIGASTVTGPWLQVKELVVPEFQQMMVLASQEKRINPAILNGTCYIHCLNRIFVKRRT